MSVRKIKKSYISCTGYFASYKNKTQVAFESTLERDFYMFLEFEKSVLKYEEQPMQINYEYSDKKKRRYTPDTLVTYIDGAQKLFEVKYANEIFNNPELQEKITILKEHIKEKHDLDFEIFTDEMVEKQYLENLKFLYKFAFIPSSDDKTNAIEQILQSNKNIEVKETLLKLHANQHKQLEYLPYIWNYVFHNTQIVDLYQKLTMKTSLSYLGEFDGQN
ncbi:MAG: TnsA endonuclease N-terminal domain-containing protein [Sulfurimonas sp.]|uniref:TnsA endonuclease N-terminal domain-containing protein n=1 Tax=Sulfurimonas sp. TaxID=2022749 RepID=UPI003D0E2066